MTERKTNFKKWMLLNDLLYFVRSGENCQLIFVGDIAQLPPVKLKLSPALSKEKLELQFNCEVDNLTLDDVVKSKMHYLVFYLMQQKLGSYC